MVVAEEIVAEEIVAEEVVMEVVVKVVERDGGRRWWKEVLEVNAGEEANLGVGVDVEGDEGWLCAARWMI